MGRDPRPGVGWDLGAGGGVGKILTKPVHVHVTANPPVHVCTQLTGHPVHGCADCCAHDPKNPVHARNPARRVRYTCTREHRARAHASTGRAQLEHTTGRVHLRAQPQGQAAGRMHIFNHAHARAQGGVVCTGFAGFHTHTNFTRMPMYVNIYLHTQPSRSC